MEWTCFSILEGSREFYYINIYRSVKTEQVKIFCLLNTVFFYTSLGTWIQCYNASFFIAEYAFHFYYTRYFQILNAIFFSDVHLIHCSYPGSTEEWQEFEADKKWRCLVVLRFGHRAKEYQRWHTFSQRQFIITIRLLFLFVAYCMEWVLVM